MTRVDKVDEVNRVDRVNRIDGINRVNSTFRDGTAEVSYKRVVRVINADLCYSINCRSFKGFLILKSIIKVS
jgi:hypothetical protein